MGLDSIVSIAPRPWGGRHGVQIPRGKRFLSFLKGPPSLLFSVLWGFFSGVKRPESEADHSPLSSDEVKNEWNYTSIPPLGPHDVYRNSFTDTILQTINQQSTTVPLFFNKSVKVKYT